MKWEEIIHFWFEEIEPAKHWVKDLEFDELIRTRFGDVHTAATKGELYHWRETANGRLAEIIVLDQFSRNMFRGHSQSFVSDPKARNLARAGVDAGLDREMTREERVFFYLPFEHSEDLADQERAVELISALGNENYTQYAQAHFDLIKRFGRFPHRNEVLGRVSTAEEVAYLAQPGSGF